MSQRVRNQIVRLTAAEPVEIEPGVTLPAGTYSAETREIGVPLLAGRIQWTAPEYLIELSESQLAEWGAKTNPNIISVEYDVTKFVRLKKLTVS